MQTVTLSTRWYAIFQQLLLSILELFKPEEPVAADRYLARMNDLRAQKEGFVFDPQAFGIGDLELSLILILIRWFMENFAPPQAPTDRIFRIECE